MRAVAKKSPEYWLRAVNNLSTSFNLASRDIELVLGLLLKSLIRELQASALGVWTVEEPLNFMKIEASAGLNSEFLRYFNQTDRVRVGKGLIGQVMTKRRTLYILDLQKKTQTELRRWQEFMRAHDFQAVVASPMFIGKKIVGAFAVYYKRARESFDRDSTRFLEIVASQVAVTLENIKNYETILQSKQSLQREITHILELQELTELIGGSFKPSAEKIMELFLNYLKERFGVAGLSLLEPDDSGKNLKVSLSLGLESSKLNLVQTRPMSLAEPTNLSSLAFIEQKAKISKLALVDARIAKPWRTLLSIQGWPALAVFPMVIGREKVGVMSVHYNRVHDFSKEEISIFDILAKYLAISLLNLRFIRTITADKEQMSSMLSSLYDGLIVYDLDGKILALNPRAEELLGVKAQELLGKTAASLDKAEKTELASAKTISFLELAEFESREITISLPHEKIFIVTMVPLKSEEGTLKIGSMRIIHDITREVEVEGLHRSFVAIASHQLRTPLTGVIWMLDGLLKGEFGRLTRDQHNYLQDGLKAADHLMSIVNDLLLVSRLDVESFEYELSSFDVYKLINKVGKNLYSALPPGRKKVKWEVEPPKEKIPKIVSDRKKLGLVLNNIIDNAFSYTKKGLVKVSVRFESVLKKSIVISVRDTGIGISQKEQKNMFVKFSRGQTATTMKPDGSGLGLFIAGEVIKRLNGKIWVESQEGKGSTFHIMVPITLKAAKK